MTTCSTSAMVPVALLAGMASARRMLGGKAARAAAEKAVPMLACKNLRREIIVRVLGSVGRRRARRGLRGRSACPGPARRRGADRRRAAGSGSACCRHRRRRPAAARQGTRPRGRSSNWLVSWGQGWLDRVCHISRPVSLCVRDDTIVTLAALSDVCSMRRRRLQRSSE
ncbi:hypothetical protein D3C87_1116120 [compost metagenome]